MVRHMLTWFRALDHAGARMFGAAVIGLGTVLGYLGGQLAGDEDLGLMIGALVGCALCLVVSVVGTIVLRQNKTGE